MNMHMSPLQKAWNVASNRMTRGKQGHADSVDENFLNHVIWYSATNWQRAYPGEAHIQWPAKLVASALRSPGRRQGRLTFIHAPCRQAAASPRPVAR